MIKQIKDWWFRTQHAAIKAKSAPGKFKRRSVASKKGWKRRYART